MNKKSGQNKALKQQSNTNDVQAAEQAAEKDIQKDFDLTPPPDPGADLDEGELARLEGED